ncbi:MAG: hypothetical protein MZV63_31575 [Marinilabiliales bacterium]|nr:hypothetical protein [Marinilabiliales bacterium]
MTHHGTPISCCRCCWASQAFSGTSTAICRNWWIVLLLFVMTGIAIVVYLNQYPNQPRERDYAYAASFYAFTIWIGLGVLALFELLRKLVGEKVAAVAASCHLPLCCVPAVMGVGELGRP